MKNQNSEYTHFTKNLQIEVRPLLAGPVYCISEFSEIIICNS